MNEVVIEHVKVEDLPAAWRAMLAAPPDRHVTVRIEPEAPAVMPGTDFATDDPAFGIWRDREDVADVQAYIRKIRASRYRRDGTRDEP
jgi:hypothetical protein